MGNEMNFAARLVGSTLVLVSSVGCWPVAEQPKLPVQHVVVCWLKNRGDLAARRELMVTSKSFVGAIPGLKRVSTGEVLPSTRPSVDSTFDVAIIMTFEDANALDAYGKNPKHLQAVEQTLKPLVARYTVYDFTESNRCKTNP